MKKIMYLMCAAALLGGTQALAAVSFKKDVMPIIKDRCISCHLPQKDHPKMKKPKAGLIMTTAEHLKKGSEEGPIVKAGDPSKSTIYTLIALPADHDDIMPPKGDPLTKEQIKTIHDWIKEGANYDS